MTYQGTQSDFLALDPPLRAAYEAKRWPEGREPGGSCAGHCPAKEHSQNRSFGNRYPRFK